MIYFPEGSSFWSSTSIQWETALVIIFISIFISKGLAKLL